MMRKIKRNIITLKKDYFRIFIILCSLFLGVLLLPNVSNAETINLQVTASADDTWEVGTDTRNTTSTNLHSDLGKSNYYGGIRFTGVNIPQGAVITAAQLKLCSTGYSTYTGRNDCLIQAEDIADAPDFAGGQEWIANRNKTTASQTRLCVGFNPGANQCAQFGPDIANVIQEIINRSDWVTGNALNILLEPTGTGSCYDHYYAISYDGSVTYAPQLHIEYSLQDTFGPERSNGQPTGTLPSGTTETTISLDTNENATCRYSTTAGMSYDSMANTFSTTGGNSHSTLVTGLSDDNSYIYYVRCSDTLDNKNTDDFLIQFSISPPSVHPRLYFTLEEMIQLKALKTASSHSAIWNEIKSWVDSRVNEDPFDISTPTLTDYAIVRFRIDYTRAYIENMAFVYFMTGETQYLDAAKEWLLSLINWSTWNPAVEPRRLLSIMAQTSAFGYDALYDYLTVDERSNLINKMTSEIGWLYDDLAPRYANPYQRNSPNTMTRLVSGIGIAGLALKDDWSGAQDWIDFATTYIQYPLATIDAEGAGREGWSYMSSMLREAVPFLNSLLRITDQDLFSGLNLDQVPYYWVYINYNGHGLQFEDIWWMNDYLYDEYRILLSEVYFLSSKYSNPYGQWFADNYAAHHRMASYVWKDPNLTPQPPDNLPLTRYFTGQGYVLFRSGWEADDLLFAFKSGTGLGHAHAAQNDFQIYYQGEGLILGGGYGYKETKQHSCILVDDLDTGGQYWVDGDESQPIEEVTLGKVEAVEVNDPYYRYLLGDASAAYEGKLDQWLRHVVFVEPNYFVIFDDVAASSPKQFYWLVHTPSLGGRPYLDISVNGDLVTLTNGPGTELKVKVIEPEGFSFTTGAGGGTYGGTRYIQLWSPTQESQTQFLTAFFPVSLLNTAKVGAGNVIGAKVTNGDDLDLILFSSDGNPVDQYIELGGYYEAADGQSYIFNGTQIRAQFSTYQVMKLTLSGAPPSFTISNTNQLYLFRDQANTLSISGSNFDLSTDFSIQFIQNSNVISSFTAQSTNGTSFTLNLTSTQTNTLPTGFYDLKVLRVSDNESQIHTKQILITQLGDLWSSTATEASEQKRDGQINLYDVSRMLSKWGSTNSQDLQEADINPGPSNVSQDKIDLYDANLIMKNWSP